MTWIMFELIDFTRNEYDTTDDKRYILDVSTYFRISAVSIVWDMFKDDTYWKLSRKMQRLFKGGT